MSPLSPLLTAGVSPALCALQRVRGSGRTPGATVLPHPRVRLCAACSPPPRPRGLLLPSEPLLLSRRGQVWNVPNVTGPSTAASPGLPPPHLESANGTHQPAGYRSGRDVLRAPSAVKRPPEPGSAPRENVPALTRRRCRDGAAVTTASSGPSTLRRPRLCPGAFVPGLRTRSRRGDRRGDMGHAV